MDYQLSMMECRVLGVLIEKELTTPEYYPLTLNALVNACNQKSNRNPVMQVTGKETEEAIESLRSKQCMWRRSIAGSRVSKYEHNVYALWHFSTPEAAIMAELLLRGPQTVGELKTHAGRMCSFDSLEAVQSALNGLADKPGGPFVKELPRASGKKENRFTHTLCAEQAAAETAPEAEAASEPVVRTGGEENDTGMLRTEIHDMRRDLMQLRREFEEFKKSFE